MRQFLIGRFSKQRIVLMAIRPIFAEAIYATRKLFEYRRVFVQVDTGDRILVYESQPISLITGEFSVGSVHRGVPETFCRFEKEDEIQKRVNDYLSGARKACALQVVNPIKWLKPENVEDFCPALKAPQSYTFINRDSQFSLNSYGKFLDTP